MNNSKREKNSRLPSVKESVAAGKRRDSAARRKLIVLLLLVTVLLLLVMMQRLALLDSWNDQCVFFQ
jgi:cell division septal protein FtsQ